MMHDAHILRIWQVCIYSMLRCEQIVCHTHVAVVDFCKGYAAKLVSTKVLKNALPSNIHAFSVHFILYIFLCTRLHNAEYANFGGNICI